MCKELRAFLDVGEDLEFTELGSAGGQEDFWWFFPVVGEEGFPGLESAV